jgi:hypothetical protein
LRADSPLSSETEALVACHLEEAKAGADISRIGFRIRSCSYAAPVACWSRKLDLIGQILLTLCSALFAALLQWSGQWFVRMPEQGISSNKVVLP